MAKAKKSNKLIVKKVTKPVFSRREMEGFKHCKDISNKSTCCSSKSRSTNDRGLIDIWESIVNKINSFIDGYGEIKDVYHVVRELSGNDDIVALIKKVTGGDRDPQIFVLLTAAILKVLKDEMEDNDGIFDYTPPKE